MISVLADLSPVSSTIGFYSTVKGELIDTASLNAEYWYENLRRPVQFESTIRALLAAGHTLFIEASPHPVLTTGVAETFEEVGVDGRAVTIGTLRRDNGGMERFLLSLAEAYVHGLPVAWPTTPTAAPLRRVDLPTYPFQRQFYWPQPTAGTATGPETAAAADPAETKFWDAIESGDLVAVADALDVTEGDGGTLRAALPVLSAWRRQRRARNVVDDWRYRVTWKPLTSTGTAALTGTWLVVPPADAADPVLPEQISSLLLRHGAAPVLLPTDPSGWTAALADHADAAGVVSLLAFDERPHPEAPEVPNGLAAGLDLLRALTGAGVGAPVWTLTRGAVGVGRSDRLDAPVQAQSWGLGRVLGLEQPERWGGLIDLPAVLDERAQNRVAWALTAPGDEDQLAVRATGVLVRRLTRAPLGAGPAGRAPWTPRGTVLVTGGTGAIGAHLAAWLAANGAERLVLTSRRGADAPGSADLAGAIEALGTRVLIEACDVADPAALGALVARLAADGSPVRSVFHAAGVGDSALLADTDPAQLAASAAAKTTGARNLDALFGADDAEPLDAFVLFSSNAGVWGGGGQGGYAAANAYLDALAQSRRDHGKPATSLAWGAWADGGMADGATAEQMRRRGIRPMPPELALGVLQQALTDDETFLAVADVDWAAFTPGFTAARPRPLIGDLPQVQAALAAAAGGGEQTATAGAAFTATLAGKTAIERHRLLLDLVREQAAAVLGHTSAEAIAPDRALRELGFDSLTSVDVRNRLNAATGLRLPTTVVFDHPTPTDLARFLGAELAARSGLALPGAEAASAGVRGTTALASVADDPIAIVAMGCRYPGAVGSPEELWELLARGGDAIAGFPADRGWPLDSLYHADRDHAGTTYATEGGFLYDAGDFDPGLFGISPREALAMDPQQRLLLETSWELLERAGIDPHTLRGSQAGVFVGAASSGYGSGLTELPDGVEGHLLTGNAGSVISGRLAYTFGFEGPAVTVDTACSSSLVALHLAAQALRQGECSLAVAGGVAVMATPGAFIEFSRQGGLAPDGRCKPFAEAADGTGWAEGVGLLLLERLSDAERHGHPVLALVRGSAVNQDGASNGLSAPNGPSQQRVIRQALAAAGLATHDIDAVEAHGTGTALGDPIEAQALLATYGAGRDEDRPLWLGSVKSNIGHTQSAAGVAGVIKMVLAMGRGLLPQTLHVDEPSRQVDWTEGPVRLLAEQREWPAGDGPRRAAVSAFGVSGTNAHVILEAAPALAIAAAAPVESADTTTTAAESAESAELTGSAATAELTAIAEPAATASLPIVLSARGAEALRAQARRIRARIEADPALSLPGLARSLATARAALDHRAVLVAGDRDRLLADLAALAGADPGPGTVTGTAGSDPLTAFLFTGQGSQRAGMGRELYRAYPAFADAFDQACAHLDRELDQPLASLVLADPDEARQAVLSETRYAQPALFALEVALFRLLESWGVAPGVLIGHSVGEIAAAHVADVLSLDDAATLVAARGRLMQALPSGGAMIAVQASEAEVAEYLGEGVDLAAVNAPEAVVLSGDEAAVTAAAAALAAAGRKTNRLNVSHAFHSARMEPMLAEFRRVLDGLDWQPATLPIVSNLTGRLAGPELSTPDYWVRHVRGAVRFADGIEAAHRFGARTFLELGPDGVLTAMARQCVEADLGFAALLRHDRPEPATALRAVATAWTRGTAVDWPALLPAAAPVQLPTYPFQRQRYWLDGATPAGAARAAAAGTDGQSAAEARFWDAVDREDLADLARTLDVTGQEPLADLLPALSSWRRAGRRRTAADGKRYRATWQPVTLTGTPAGRWLVVLPADADDALRALAAAVFAGTGAEPVTVHLAADADRAAVCGRLVAALEDAPATGVLSLLALNTDDTDDPAGNLTLLQALGDAGVEASLWLATRGAVSIGRSDPATGPGQAAAWGLGLVAALEHPGRWGGLLDLPAELDGATPARLRAVLGGTGEDQVAIRRSGLFARRLTRAALPVGPTDPGSTGTDPWRPAGTVLVSGTGPIADRISAWLADRGAAQILRVGAPTPNETEGDELDPRITRVALAALPDLLATHPVTAVFHVDAAADLTPLAAADGEFADRLRERLAAARQLDALTRDHDLSAFVLCSTILGTLGGIAHGQDTAAHAYLEALAAHRRGAGRPAVSVAWGPWTTDDPEAVERWRRNGVTAVDPELALDALQAALDHEEPALAVADVDWARFAAAFTAGRPSPLLGSLPEAAAVLAEPAAPGPDASSLARTLAQAPEARRGPILLDLVRANVAAVLGYQSPDAVEPDRAFREAGFDSLTAVELSRRLTGLTGLRLASTLVFDHPSPSALAAHLLTELAPGTTGRAQATARAHSAAGAPGEDDPIAIVSMSCRYPGGVRTPEDLWDLVAGGTDAVSGFPADRGWDLEALYNPDPLNSGTCYVREGGFLYDAGDFDPAFFGISPREALAMDPQQRALLEISWEALERAGIDPHTLRGTPTGVFAGTNGQDYASLLAGDAEAEGYVGTGNAASVASGRLAYTFGFEGPAVTVDTACSSSLVALHLGAQALRNGECSLVLAGGVIITATPGVFIEFSRQQGLASDGRCKSFAAAADGTGWGEGAGMLVLERLSDARRNGHPVLALVRGTAVNQDGASNGLTAPNGLSQQRVIRQALANAGLSTNDVDVVEAHGTGTKLGDPIEAQALIATYGQDRPEDKPLWLGSLKSNIGHTQAAAGVGGIIKMVMAMQHGVMPRTLHVDEPSPHVDWSAGAVELLTEAREWAREGERPRRAGVSSFGVSGTNAHVVIEHFDAAGADALGSPEAAAPTAELVSNAEITSSPEIVPTAWTVSARGSGALRAQAARLLAHAQAHPEASPADLGLSLAATRSTFAHRAVLIGSAREELVAGLEILASADAADATSSPGAPVVHQGEAVGGRTAVAFTGQGAQRLGMGEELRRTFPFFARTFDEVCAHLDLHLDRPLAEVVFGDGAALDQTGYTQAALFALEVALYRLLEHWGVQPDYLIGHSIGEVAAAHVAGVFTLPDAARLVAARGRLMQALPEGGGMLAVESTEEEVARILAEELTGEAGPVGIAAVNGPRAVVVSGAFAALDQVEAIIRARGGRAKRLTVSHAFHSPLMEPMLAEFRRGLDTVEFHNPYLPIVSNLTGTLAGPEIATADYWVRHVREAVRFHDGVELLKGLNVVRMLEVGPGGVLCAMAQDGFAGADTVLVPALRADRPEAESLLGALARLHTHGADVDWTALFEGVDARRVALPTYAFQRQRFWPRGATLNPAGRGAESAVTDAHDPTETGFWSAVENGDLEALTTALDADEATSQSWGQVLPALSTWRRAARRNCVLDSWRYRAVWRPLADPADTRSPLSGTWLLVTPAHLDPVADPAIDAVAQGLTAHGAKVRLVPVTGAAALPEALAEALVGDAPTGVLSLLALDGRAHPAIRSLTVGMDATLALLRELGAPGAPDIRLWVATRGAVAVGASEHADAAQAQYWGLGRVAALELPQRWGGLVDLPAELTGRAAERLAATLADPAEDQVALRPAGLFTRRFERAALPASAAAWQPSGTVLVTGGTGALGARVARWLAEHGAEHLVLASRRGQDAPGMSALCTELAELGARTTVAACDAADRDQVRALVDRLDAEGTPIRAVVHAAGVSQQTPISACTPEEFGAVVEAKVAGAVHLDEALAGRDLDAFVLFSSIAATWGGGAQPAYAAANAFLDALAENRRSRGLSATAVAWGPWGGGGMAAEGAAEEQLRKRGLTVLDPQLALAALGQAVGAGEAAVTVADVDWSLFAPGFTALRPSPFLAALPEVQAALAGPAPQDPAEAGAAAKLRADLAALSEDDAHQVLLELVRTQVAAALGHAGTDAVGAARPFGELGFDSLTAIELRNRLNIATGLKLASSLVFDYPTPTELARHLAAELGQDGEPATASAFTELDRLEAALAAGRQDALTRTKIMVRMQAMLARWTDEDDAAADATGAGAPENLFDSASDEELFAFINNDFGGN
ncbi:MAG TPA: SDR family NAD(P)-dependent oxidoreductase [Actinocrinis sp.]|nr:SDR family NAD(P)-dependent oxidoreductase [Actinocrinis sp.]